MPKSTVNILLVDDKPQNLYSLEKILTAPNQRIFKASSGNDALAQMLRNNFACVLLDVQMPEMDGFEVAQIIRNDPQLQALPIIFVTAYERSEFDTARAYGAGAVDVLFKPLDPFIAKSKVAVFAELHRSRRIIERQAKELSSINRELQHLTYACSHDLKEPLRMVASYVQMLRRRYSDKLDGEAQEYISFAVDGAKRMARIIDDMLEYARTGEVRPSLTLVDLNEIVDRVRGDLKTSIDELDVQFEVPKLPTIAGDESLTRRLMQNLFSNAIKYRRETPPRVKVRARVERDEYVISVEDNGLGFDMKHADRVFSMFTRLHDRSKSNGSGIGLATCKKIVEIHGGRIWVESSENVGTKFSFTFPIPQTKPVVPN
jgi:signal transduction histidine kinase